MVKSNQLLSLAQSLSPAQLHRWNNLLAFRREMRERDSFCGDGVAFGRYYSRHGFQNRPGPLGPVARADLEIDTE